MHRDQGKVCVVTIGFGSSPKFVIRGLTTTTVGRIRIPGLYDHLQFNVGSGMSIWGQRVNVRPWQSLGVRICIKHTSFTQ